MITLAQAREQKGLSVADLAGASGVPESTINAIEAGSEDPSISTVLKLVAVLGVGIHDISDWSQGSGGGDLSDETRLGPRVGP